MKEFIKTVVGKIGAGFVSLLSRSQVGRFLQNEMVKELMLVQATVHHNGCSLNFSAPNMLNYFRADSFSTKEPETLEWIDRMPKGSIVWDIGANVGLYSCYAAKHRNCKVYAFEPSVFNLELLARNIFINGLVDNITIIPLPLSDKLRSSSLNISSTDWGGALSTCNESYGHDGKELDKIFGFSTIGLSMEDAVKTLKIPLPDYIKMDVDGIEHLILKGGNHVLLNIKGILVEVNDDYIEQEHNVTKYLNEAGLILQEKRHSEMFTDSDLFSNSFNQIWLRKEH